MLLIMSLLISLVLFCYFKKDLFAERCLLYTTSWLPFDNFREFIGWGKKKTGDIENNRLKLRLDNSQ